MSLRFDEEKATQTAAFFLALRGGQMHYIKLIKLLYLTDREALMRWGVPVTTDRHASMDNGPVVSRILNLITEDKPKPIWAKYISAPLGEYEVCLLAPAPTDRLSRAEENLMREIFAQYGHLNRWHLIDTVMHKLPEWRNPQGRIPSDYCSRHSASCRRKRRRNQGRCSRVAFDGPCRRRLCTRLCLSAEIRS